MQLTLVCLHHQHVVAAALGDLLGDFPLAAYGVYRDDTTWANCSRRGPSHTQGGVARMLCEYDQVAERP